MADPVTLRSRPGRPAFAFAWAGGALFLASLLYYVYAYLVPFGRPSESADFAASALADTAMFTFFAIHHSLLARSGAKMWMATLVPSWLERSVYTWVASLLFLLTCAWWQAVPGTAWSLAGPLRVVGYGIQALGFALTVAGSSAIDVLDLAGIRPVLNARDARPPRHVPLETAGVYRLVRHPLYLGWALFVFGVPDMTGTRLVFAVVTTFYLIVAIPLEERSLQVVFHDEYRAYQQRTRWRMFPGIW